MDKQKIKTAYDDYVDATVALFVECYSEACAERIHEEMTACSEENVAFPAALDKRCRELIKKEDAKRQRKQFWKTAKRISTSAAIVVLVMLALASVLFATVEAVRIPIINYFIEHGNGYWEITSRDSYDRTLFDIIDPTDPLTGLVPDEYDLFILDDFWPEGLTALYVTPDNKEIFFSIDPSESVARLDSENSQIIDAVEISGCDGFFIIKDNKKSLVWGQEESSIMFCLFATDLTESETIEIATLFMNRLQRN